MNLYEKINNNGIYTIAEMSANHAGDINIALEIAQMAKQSGADCIKVQTYTADTMTLDIKNDYFKLKGGLWDGYYLYDLYKEAHMPWEWQKIIKEEADKLGLDFISTPFDNTAVDFLESLDVEMYKIASYELTDIPLLKYTASKGKPLIISTGMGSFEEISQAVEAVKSVGNNQIILLKCTSEYPADFADMNLGVIPKMRAQFNLPIGFSDHSLGSDASVVAVSLGACVIEKHFCLNRNIKNPDSEFSMEPKEFERLIADVNRAKTIKGQETYDLCAKEEVGKWLRRSVFASKDIKKGEEFTTENTKVIRPAFGLPPKEYPNILGKISKCEIKKGTPLSKEHL